VRSRTPRRAVGWLVLAAALLATACQREERRFSETPLPRPTGEVSAKADPTRTLPVANPYENNAFALSEGKRLFVWFNCSGCHANGGGGMGPALMDDAWLYGSAPAQIFATIVEGRPNGMPSFGGKLSDQQVWQLVSYVRSLSGQARFDVASSRDDHMMVKPSELSMPREQPKEGQARP
jgi:cytochrome c oxidase cbb3-type subunit 3